MDTYTVHTNDITTHTETNTKETEQKNITNAIDSLAENIAKTDLVDDISYDNLETGDILLYSENTYWFSQIIKFFTRSEYSHCAIVIRDPKFAECLGLYILESGIEDVFDAENHRRKFGVQLVPFREVIDKYNGQVYVRRLKCVRDENFYERLSAAHSNVHNETYDTNIFDMVRAVCDEIDGLPTGTNSTQKQTAYWCSALVAYIYVSLGFLPEMTPWTLIFPKQFSTQCEDNALKFQNCELSAEILIHSRNNNSADKKILYGCADTECSDIKHSEDTDAQSSLWNWFRAYQQLR